MVVEREAKRCHSVGSIVDRWAWQPVLIDRVSVEPVAGFFRHDQQLAIVIKPNLGGVSRDAANQGASRASQGRQRSIVLDGKPGNIWSSTLVEHVQQIIVERQADGTDTPGINDVNNV